MAKKDNTGKILGLIALAAGGYFVYQKFIKEDDEATTPTNAKPGSGPSKPAPAIANNYPIVYMKYHPDVKLLQAAVGVAQDGVIGPKTLTALQPYWAVSTALKIPDLATLQYIIGMVKQYDTRPMSPIPITGSLTYAEDVQPLYEEWDYAGENIAGIPTY